MIDLLPAKWYQIPENLSKAVGQWVKARGGFVLGVRQPVRYLTQVDWSDYRDSQTRVWIYCPVRRLPIIYHCWEALPLRLRRAIKKATQ